MKNNALKTGDTKVIDPAGLQIILDELHKQEYRVYGPTVREGIIAYDEISSTEDLPVGYTDQQSPASYRLVKRRDKALFGFVVSQHSWKQIVYPPRETIWSAEKSNDDYKLTENVPESPKLAFIGVRPCEIKALFVQDKVFTQSQYKDKYYQMRRRHNFILAVNCTEPGGNCFCSSMDAGPKATKGFDLAMTEVIDKDKHYFYVEIGSKKGGEILSLTEATDPSEEQKDTVEKLLAKAEKNMGRTLNTTGLKELLYRNIENQHWEEVAKRCLTCTSCTMVCPTCFCCTIEDTTGLNGKTAGRVRRWDSCMNVDYSYVHGGSVRTSEQARYRHWITHKLATWQDQFGMSGCVGCGRCITWCPAGIDITEEVEAIRKSEAARAERATVKE